MRSGPVGLGPPWQRSLPLSDSTLQEPQPGLPLFMSGPARRLVLQARAGPGDVRSQGLGPPGGPQKGHLSSGPADSRLGALPGLIALLPLAVRLSAPVPGPAGRFRPRTMPCRPVGGAAAATAPQAAAGR